MRVEETGFRFEKLSRLASVYFNGKNCAIDGIKLTVKVMEPKRVKKTLAH